MLVILNAYNHLEERNITSTCVICRHLGHAILPRSSLNYRLHFLCFLSTKNIFFLRFRFDSLGWWSSRPVNSSVTQNGSVCCVIVNILLGNKTRILVTTLPGRGWIPRHNRRLNLLKPTGHVMQQQFNTQQLYTLPTLYLCVLYLSENKQRLVPRTA
jgi:hypothetical protein